MRLEWIIQIFMHTSENLITSHLGYLVKNLVEIALLALVINIQRVPKWHHSGGSSRPVNSV
jgi:hypothetical protein